MSTDAVIGWDLGGAHLKAARLGASGRIEAVVQRACPLWQGMPHLVAAIDHAMKALGAAPRHAITMTGEMVDLFASRGEGVSALVGAMQARLPGVALRFYAGRAGFVEAAAAAAAPERVASANWMASAALVAANIEAGLLIDIGSTTTDLVPVAAGTLLARGHDDASRLVTGELVYTGVARTALMAVAPQVPLGGEWVPLMAEYFATTADIHRLCDQLPDGADQHPAADSGEKTAEASARRLARMVGRDVASAPLAAWRRLAAWLVAAQVRRIEDACDLIGSRGELPDDAPFVAAGVGRFLVPAIAARRGRQVVEFADLVPADPSVRSLVADCAPAAAVAWLLRRGPS